MDFNFIYSLIKDCQNRRQLKKASKYMESVADGYWQACQIAVTWHGRYKLAQVIQEAEAGNIEMSQNVVSFYRVVLMTAPYQQHAIWN